MHVMQRKTLLQSELEAGPKKSKKLLTGLSMLNIRCFNSNQLKRKKSFEYGDSLLDTKYWIKKQTRTKANQIH